MEQLDVYDLNRERTGRILPREDVFSCLAGDERILLVHACVFSSVNSMLIQRRRETKDRYPGCWDVSAGGFVSSGEESPDAAVRELNEELGLILPKDCLVFVRCEPFGKVLDDFYNVYLDADISELSLQESEVMDAVWAGRDEILEMIRSGRFVDYSEELIQKLFDAAESRLNIL